MRDASRPWYRFEVARMLLLRSRSGRVRCRRRVQRLHLVRLDRAVGMREVPVVGLHLRVVRGLDGDGLDFAGLKEAVDDAAAARDDRAAAVVPGFGHLQACDRARRRILHFDGRLHEVLARERLRYRLHVIDRRFALDWRRDLLTGQDGRQLRGLSRDDGAGKHRCADERRGDGKMHAIHIYPPDKSVGQRITRGRDYTALPYISPFQSSGSGFTVRTISMCHFPPPQGSITSAATTSTSNSEKSRPSGSPSRWYAGSSQPKLG